MKPITLQAQFAAEMDCPKEVVMWNYYDHEHLVGTHFKLYDKARVLAEKDNWCLVFRSKRMPLLPFYTGGIGFMYMDGNTMKSFHKDTIGFMLEMEALFTDLPNDRCRVNVTYRINTHPFFKIFHGMFTKLFEKWFWATWEEDAPMRLRRWKVHKLGFKDFVGIDYINKKSTKPAKLEYPPYIFDPPVKTSSPIKTATGIKRPFDHSTELGYADSDYVFELPPEAQAALAADAQGEPVGQSHQ
jgi:hypothetical protein